MSVWTWIGVALLGGVGANARFLVDALVTARAGGELPVGTLAVNASGSLLLGLATGVTLGGSALVLAGTATLGSYTTFSTWDARDAAAGRGHEVPRRLLNVLVSLAVGIAAVALGRAIGARL